MSCPIDECVETITSERVMCRRHWYMVPRDLRSEVWDAWRERLESPLDQSLVGRYEQAKAAAIEAVNAKVRAS